MALKHGRYHHALEFQAMRLFDLFLQLARRLLQ
jgi:hypothetical protein